MILVIRAVVEVYLWGILLPRAVLSWFPAQPGTFLASLNHFFYVMTEPVLAPVRRILPPIRAGGMGIDLSFLVVFIGLNILVGLL